MPVSAAIERYLRTGAHDPYFFDWSDDVIERERLALKDLKQALVDEVSRRAAGRAPSAEMPTINLMALTRAKIESMLRGLFPPPKRSARPARRSPSPHGRTTGRCWTSRSRCGASATQR